MRVTLGLEAKFPKKWKAERVGVVMHPASINSRFVPVNEVLSSQGITLGALFGPQHGILGETQDNMIEWEGFKDPDSGLPIYSLYGQHRTPTHPMLQGLDRLIIDLQDVGARYYTFIWTMLNCMRAAFDQGLAVSVLDRPNPIGAERVEGPLLNMDYQSFVGLAPIPVRHGMTIGELANWFKSHFQLQGELEIIGMNGYRRGTHINELDVPWVFPSPNMPTPATADVYPGGCLLEATNLSEGRGTTIPFELVGAPFISSKSLIQAMGAHNLPGVHFREVHFQPTFHKWSGKLCHGVHVHVTDRQTFKPFATYCLLIAEIKNLFPQDFEWLQPPYEYNYHHMPIDILSGDDSFRKQVDSGKDLWPWLNQSEEQARLFHRTQKDCWLYD